MEAREDIGEEGPACVALEEELVGVEVATREERSGREKEGVEHDVVGDRSIWMRNSEEDLDT